MFAVEFFASHRLIAVFQKMGFDDGLECGFAGRLHVLHSNSEEGAQC